MQDELLEDALISKEEKLSAAETLRQIMNFNRLKAQALIVDIIILLRAQNKGDGVHLAIMYKKFAEAEQIAIDCASKLAPYETPRLQALEVKNEITHRFVLRAPEQAKDNETWLKQIEGNKQIDLKDFVHDAVTEEASSNGSQ